MSDYDQSVFINCPFDESYLALFEALVFASLDCGFEARCTKEIKDSGQVRIDKIVDLVRQCKYGIHDISRTELDKKNNLPRFNMPLELGVFLGAKEFGDETQREKLCLVLDCEQYRYQKFCSDIAGQDIEAHAGDPEKAIKITRDWLSDSLEEVMIPSGSKIADRYDDFREEMPIICNSFRLKVEELTFIDFRNVIKVWLRENSW